MEKKILWAFPRENLSPCHDSLLISTTVGHVADCQGLSPHSVLWNSSFKNTHDGQIRPSPTARYRERKKRLIWNVKKIWDIYDAVKDSPTSRLWSAWWIPICSLSQCTLHPVCNINWPIYHVSTQHCLNAFIFKVQHKISIYKHIYVVNYKAGYFIHKLHYQTRHKYSKCSGFVHWFTKIKELHSHSACLMRP